MTRGKLGPGTLLDGGRFEVTRAIKEGGMGAVYEVMDRRLSNKRCALKEMLSASRDPDDRRQAREHFISEVQVMLGLRHPNIPRFTASFMQENSFYFVMEYIQGADLSCVLKERGSPGLPVDEVVSYGCQLLGALKYIHALNPPIVHRDIKPSNILRRDEDGTVVLIDFGIARVSNPGEGLWIGTPGYAPPEQQAGKPEPCSDVYALAATLHQLITGAKPEDFDFEKFKKYGIQVDPRLGADVSGAHLDIESVRPVRTHHDERGSAGDELEWSSVERAVAADLESGLPGRCRSLPVAGRICGIIGVQGALEDQVALERAVAGADAGQPGACAADVDHAHPQPGVPPAVPVDQDRG
mgnify:CR=1 FL=1